MCTASYLPYANNGFILTHSRDEKAIRPTARAPRTMTIGGQAVTFPQDPQGMGTWIAVSQQRTVCLLNGAFMAHQPAPPYKHSRGLVALHSFNYETVEEFVNHYDFAGIEPFTLLLAEDGELTELRWNGQRLTVSEKDPHQPHIWSSVTLYPAEIIQKRESWFRKWQGQIPYWSPNAIRAFHLSAGEGDSANALRMNRQNQYLTVSLTQITREDDQTELRYEDLIQPTLTNQTFTADYATV